MVPNFLYEYSVQILLYNMQSPFDLKSYKRLPEIKKMKWIIIIIKNKTSPLCAFYKFDFYW